MPFTELVEDRLRFLEIDEDALAELQRARQYIEPEIDRMLARFYAHILNEVELQSLFEDAESIKRARDAQKKHWLKSIFSGRFTSSYFTRADKIGRTHARVGLAPNLYIGGYGKMLHQFIDRIASEAAKEGQDPTATIQAVCKAVLLDIDVVIHCYLEAKNEVMRQVLRRATDFATDMAGLSEGLGDASKAVRDTTASLADTEAKSGEQSRQLQELLRSIESLAEQSDKIGERIAELQFVDRLYIEEDTTTFDRLKALFGRD